MQVCNLHTQNIAHSSQEIITEFASSKLELLAMQNLASSDGSMHRQKKFSLCKFEHGSGKQLTDLKLNACRNVLWPDLTASK
jgi:hypothetical protein